MKKNSRERTATSQDPPPTLTSLHFKILDPPLHVRMGCSSMHVCFMILVHVCFMFASPCKQSINHATVNHLPVIKFLNMQFYISAYTTLNELLAVFLYIIFAVLLKFERSLNSYFIHNNNNYYYYCLHHLGFCYLFNIMASLYVGPQHTKFHADG